MKIFPLKKAAFKNFREELKEFYLLNVASIDTNKSLNKFFGDLRFASRKNFLRFESN